MIAAWQSHYWRGATPAVAAAATSRSAPPDTAELLRAELLANGPYNLVSKGFITQAEVDALAD